MSSSASIPEASEGNSTNEDDGDDETEKTPNKVKEKLVSSLREALLENVKEMLNGENSKQLLEEAQTVTDDKPVNLTNTQEEDEGSAESVNPNKDTVDSHFAEGEAKTLEQEASAKETDSQATNLLETNLMKIDKRKLAHLLATLMKKYKSDGLDIDYAESGVKSNEKGKGVPAESDQKHSDERNENSVKVDKDKSSNQKPKLTKAKHHENAMLRAGLTSDFFDPYAQIGLTDPKLSGNPATVGKSKEDVSPTGRHSVHINLFGDDAANKEKGNTKSDDSLKASKEFEGKVETETQRAEEIVNEKVEKQKARLEAEVAKAHAKEGLENEDFLKENQEMMKQPKDEEAHKDIKENEKEVESNKDMLNTKQMENIKIAHMKPNQHIEENVVIKANQNDQSEEKDVAKMMENAKNVDANEGYPKHGQMEFSITTPVKDKSDTMKEEQNVKAELVKEKEELKMLREEEKLEKAKEEELKMANAELEEKDKKTRDAFLEKVKQEQMKDVKEREETENQNQLKAAHEQDEEKERTTNNKEKQLKAEKVEEEEQQRLKQIRENQLKAEKSAEKAGKAEITAENAEKEIEKVEEEADNQVKLEKLIEEKGKLNGKDKQIPPVKGIEDGNPNIKPSSMEETVKENSGNMKEKSGKGEEVEDTNTKDLLVEKTKENELKAFVSVLEEKEKKEKSIVKEKEEELNKKEMELKEAEKQVELEEDKKSAKQHHGEKSKELMESKDLPDKESQDIENYNSSEKNPTTAESNRYIHVVSPELISAITNNIQDTKAISASEENAGDKHDDSTTGSSSAGKGVQVPSHIMEAEKEATKFADATPMVDKLPKDKKQDKVSSEGKEKKVSMEEKEPMESKPSMQEKEVTEGKQDKISLEEKLPTDTKQNKLSIEAKGPDRTGEREGKNYEDTKEKSKAEKEKEMKERNEDFAAIDGPNIETLIEHMEERMRQRKKEKEISKEATKYSKEGRKKNHYIDDAYAQIGSMDPNVKRRKIGGKLKKHSRHHHLKNKKD